MITGWVFSRSQTIDRVQLLVDGTAVGNATLYLPRWDIDSDLPDAKVCGVQINLRPEQMPIRAEEVQVQFVARTISGQTVPLPARSILLGPPSKRDATPDSPKTPLLPSRRGSPRKKPKVACFAHSLGYAGGQLYLQELLRQFAARGELDCAVRSPERGPLQDELSALGFAVHVFQEPSRVNAARHDRTTEAISKWLVDNEFDCVLANTMASFYAINAASAAGIPSIWAIHESLPVATWSAFYALERPGGEFFSTRVTAALRRAAAVVFESEATRRLFLEYDEAGRFLKIPYGINVSEIDAFLRDFDRQKAREALGIPARSPVLLCMGNVEPRKQQIFLARSFLEVLADHDEAILLMVGDFPSDYSQALHAYLDRRDPNRRIRILPAAREPYPWYAVADGFVLLSALESMPRSMMEAMAFGLPVVASNIFGIPELVEDEKSGFLVEPNSLRGAVEGMKKLLSLSQEKRMAMVRAARRKIETDHDSRGYAGRYHAMIRNLVQPGSTGPG